jgi:predicted phosphodiesterase
MAKIALIADIHEDVVSLKKALKMIEGEKCGQIICLGDILGYPIARGRYEDTRDAAECIALIKSHCSGVLLGNHDCFHLKRIPEHRNGFKFPAGWFELSPDQQTEVSANKVWNYTDDHPVVLTDKDIEYLSNQPEIISREYGGRKILFSHFLYPNFSAYISSFNGGSIKLNDHFRYLGQQGYDLSVCGHMHMEGIGISYGPGENLLTKLFQGFIYYSYGERKLKNKCCCVTIPSLADNHQVNGFAILNTIDFSINVLSLNINRRFIL